MSELLPKDIIYEFSFNKDIIEEKNEYIPGYDNIYKSISTSLEIKEDGYNIYIIDDFSKNKIENIKNFISKILKKKNILNDICYVIYDDPKNPKVLFLPKGNGNKLKKTLENLQIDFYESTFNFYNSTANKEKEALIDNVQKRRNEIINKLEEKALNYEFETKITQEGFMFVPLKDEKTITEKEYENLSKEKKEEILNKVNELKQDAEEILEELKKIEDDEIEKIKKIFKKHFDSNLKESRETYYKEFAECKDALKFLEFIYTEIENNIVYNYSIDYEEDETKINEIINKYEINVLVDNSMNENPQVIFEEDPSVNNLLGSIEYENKNNVYTTDISLINAGSILKANEGCLIIRTNSLLSNPQAYYYLKKTLLSGKVNLDYNRGYLELLSLNNLKPEPINIEEKIILIGDYETYDFLYNYDEDFKKIFKIRCECNPIVDINENTKKFLVSNIYSFCNKNNLKPITEKGITEIAKFLSRKAENKNKIFFDDDEINKLLIFSSNKVKNEDKEYIDAEDIIESAYFKCEAEKEILDNYKEGKILINVNGEIIGQINGLSVIDAGYFKFGKPIKITCSCYKGEGNIIDVQKESNMSGSIHSKSISILKGYINKFINPYTKLPVDFHLSFEQIYGKIDGDSASVAEILCMISALSKIPLKQNIAVTGSVNQFGEVQAIGGVNEKIEGFFNICKTLDNTIGKGVLIPYSNKNDIVLNKEVEDEIKKGNFHIYTMKNIEEGIEVLMCNEKISINEVFNSILKEIKKFLSSNKK